MSKTLPFKPDALVVGSGISGGIAAKELCELGLKVFLLDRGREVLHPDSYTTAFKAPWEMPHAGKLPLNQQAEFETLTRVHNKVSEYTSHFFTKDAEQPYLEEQRFDWVRGYQLGGKSITWGRIALRFSDLDFEANLREGVGADWPIRYKDLEKWYDRVERFAGIAGSRDGLTHLPDGQFQPPMPLTCVEEHLQRQVRRQFPGRHVIHARQAHLTEPTEEQLALGRSTCQKRNMCSRGCPFGAYFSSVAASIPAAKKTNNLHIITDSVVKEVVYDDTHQRAVGVRIINTYTLQEETLTAPLIFLNASAIGTTQILMNSKSKRFPNGLGNDSGVLGKYLMDHHFGAGAIGEAPGFENFVQKGRRPNGFYVPRFQNIGADKRDYLRGFAYEGDSRRQRPQNVPGFGAEFKKQSAEFGPWKVYLNAFAETLPYEQNQLTLHATEKDRYGIPLLVFDAAYGENEQKMRPDMASNAAEMLEAAGFKNIETYDEIRGFGRCIHEMGTARMGHSAKESVLNKYNQVWGAENVFVTDGAAMVSGSCVNPSLTYMALAARAAHFAVDWMKKK